MPENGQRTALVTASSQGIGKACAERLLETGHRVAINARDEERLHETAASLKKLGEVIAIPADLTEPSDLTRLIAEVEEAMGGVDVLVANTHGPAMQPFLETTVDQWREGFDGMVLPVLELLHAFLPGMCTSRWGRVVFITSTWVRQPRPGGALSAANRSVLSALVRQLSDEVAGSGVLVHQVMPGPTKTQRSDQIVARLAATRGVSEESIIDEVLAEVPVGRYGTAAEVAALVGFLASDQAGFMSGTSIPVDGGQIRSVL